MKLCYGNDYIVRFKSGKIWHFFSKKGRGIYFRRLEKSRGWQNDIQLVPDVHDYFSLSIDSHDTLHLVCQSHNGEIKYMKYNGKSWDEQLVTQYDPSMYIVQFPSIVPFNGRIHIFFSTGSNPPTGTWSIHHCYFNDGSWIDGEITKYTAQNQSSPLYFDFDHKNLHIIYRGIYYNKFQIFHCRFDDNLKRWSKPERITRSLADCNTPSLLLKGNRLHLAWTSIENSNLQVKYISWNFNQYFKTGTESETLLSNKESNCLYPQLLWANNQLWCIWYQNNDLYCCSSSDDGITWTEAKPIEWSHIEHCYCIRYRSNFPEDRAAFKVHRAFANLVTGLELSIIGEYMDLPVPASAQQKKTHEPSQEAATPPLQRDENMPFISPESQSISYAPASQDSGHPDQAAQDSIDPNQTAQENIDSDPSVQDSLPPESSPQENAQIKANEEAEAKEPCESPTQESTPCVSPAMQDETLSPPEPEIVHSNQLQARDNSREDYLISNQTADQENTNPNDNDSNGDETTASDFVAAESPADTPGQPDASADESSVIVSSIRALLDEMDRIDGLKTKLQSLLIKPHSQDNSIALTFKLDGLLNLWIKKAETIQAQNQIIMREIEMLRRRSIENQRQWEILIEEFEEIKDLLDKNRRKGLLNRFLGRSLAN